MIDAIDTQIAPLDKELRAYARRRPGRKALLGHYGIGPITSVTILAELGDPNPTTSRPRSGSMEPRVPVRSRANSSNAATTRCGSSARRRSSPHNTSLCATSDSDCWNALSQLTRRGVHCYGSVAGPSALLVLSNLTGPRLRAEPRPECWVQHRRREPAPAIYQSQRGRGFGSDPTNFEARAQAPPRESRGGAGAMD